MKRGLLAILGMMIGLSVIAQTFESSNLPILNITTAGTIEDEPKINGRLQVIYNGPGVRNNVNGDPTHVNEKIGIEIRGQSSQSFDKKGYGFEWRDIRDDDMDVAFLSFPEESDFVLHGPYSDKSLVRNALAYVVAGSIMDYAPRVEMVEVIINTEYRGVYLLTEKIKRGDDRVDVNKLKDDELTGDDLTGGYIFKSDKIDEGDAWWESKYAAFAGTTSKPRYVMHYPKADDIQNEQINYIKGVVGNFEDVMNNTSFENSSTGYPSLIDIQTFVDFFFINEISRNVDGYRISTYFHKDKDSNGGKIKAGPVWDFNLGFGNADYCDGWMTSGWAYNFNQVCPSDGLAIPFWWDKLINSTTFKERTRDRWDALRQDELSTSRVLAIYDSLTIILDESQARNFQKFGVLGQYVWPNFNVSNTYSGEVLWTRTWIEDRLNWMDAQISSFPSSITNPDYLTDFQIYPMPFHSNVTIDLVPRNSGAANFIIYDALGRTVWQTSMDMTAGQHTRSSFDMELPSGYYVYQVIQSQELIKTGKLIRE